MSAPALSIVIPFFNEEDSLPLLLDALRPVLEQTGRSYEVVLVDDGSTDGSLQTARALVSAHPGVMCLELQGNFGKSAALAAGFARASGELIFTMDADLQDDPKEIPRFLEAIDGGQDVVSGWKRTRHDPLSKVVPSRIFNWVIRRASGLGLHDINCGFKCYRRDVVEAIPVYGELHRFLPLLAHWKRFQVGEIEVEHHARRFGHSKFGFERLAKGFFDFLTVLFLLRFDKRPMHLFGLGGLLSSLAGLLICSYLSVIWFLTRLEVIDALPIGNRPLLTLGVLLIVVGAQFFGIGLLAELVNYHMTDRHKPYVIRKVHAGRDVQEGE